MKLITRRQSLSIGGAFIGATFFDFFSPIGVIGSAKTQVQSTLWVTAFGPKPAYRDGKNDASGTILDQESEVFFWDKNHDFFSFKVPFLPHSIIQNPINTKVFAILPKWGSNAAEIDLERMSLKTRWQAEPGCRFFGHGFYSQNGKSIFTSQSDEFGNRSFIGIYNLHGAKPVFQKEIRSPHGRIHECAVSRSNREILVCGNLGPLMRFDFSKHTLINSVKIGQVGPSHIYQTADDYILYGGIRSPINGEQQGSILGAINSNNITIPVNIPPDQETHFKGEALSLTAIESSGLALATLWASNSIFVFEYRTGKLIHRIDSPSPMGIYLSDDQQHFFVTSKDSRAIIKYSAKTFEKIDSWNPPETQVWSSHVFKVTGSISEYKKKVKPKSIQI